ncbi:MAG: DUF401 family protein [Pseudomonadota bacterium]
MDYLLHLPALVKMLLAFGMILGLYRFNLHLSAGLFAGSTALGLLMGLSVWETVRIMFLSLLEAQSASLALIVAVILVLSKLMNDSGQLDRIVTSFSRVIHSTKAVTLIMPALIGLLPMPGGALFSAPMVESAAKRAGLGPEEKTAVNYWFRHIWEYWWPLYPGVVLAVSLLGVPAWKFMLVQFPLTLITVAVGMIFIGRLVSVREEPATAARDEGKWKDFRREVRPITLIILAIPGVKVVELVIGRALPSLTAVFLGLALCLGWVIFQNHIKLPQVVKATLSKSTGAMVLLIFGIMAFKGILVESRAVADIQSDMGRFGIPPLLIICLVPFLSGLVTGIAVGFVGSSFPLVVPLLANLQGVDYLAHASLAYAFGYMGMMLSPVHLCLLVTKDYFSASLVKTYRLLAWPTLTVMVVVLAGFGLVQLLV